MTNKVSTTVDQMFDRLQKLVDALASGKYSKCVGVNRVVVNKHCYYCATGVAIDTFIKGTIGRITRNSDAYKRYYIGEKVFPDEIISWYVTPNIFIDFREFMDVTWRLNDGGDGNRWCGKHQLTLKEQSQRLQEFIETLKKKYKRDEPK